MTGNVLKEIEENIKDYEEQGIEQIPLSLVKYWISVLEKDNEQLKKELQKYNDWCNSIKRENIDKVLKMSVFEIVELFEYYDEKIEDYEKVLNGDVE